MKTPKIEKESWTKMCIQAHYLKDISVPMLMGHFEIPRDKAELLLKIVTYSREQKLLKVNQYFAMRSKFRMACVHRLRDAGLQYAVISKVTKLSVRHCQRLEREYQKDWTSRNYEMIDADRKSWIENIVKRQGVYVKPPKDKTGSLSDLELNYYYDLLAEKDLAEFLEEYQNIGSHKLTKKDWADLFKEYSNTGS